MEDRRLAAIMFTDIVGYTALMGSDEDKAFDMLKRNHTIHENLIRQYNGKLIKEIGDGTLASFSLASDAVRCAIDIQKGCKEQNIPLKIGIHEGEMVFTDADVLGNGVNIASRLLDSAEDGCITISGSVYRDIKNKAGIRTEFIEEKVLKNVDGPIRIYEVTCEEFSPFKSNKKDIEPRPPSKKSIIVLPFVNMSPDPDQEYFSDGLTEEIITDLSHIHDLLVISRSSAMTFKGTKKKIREVASEVNVHYVLEGSVRKAGNHLRITAQLIDAVNDSHLWAEKYSGTLDDVFDIQEKVSRSIVDALQVKLNSLEKKKITEHPIDNIKAFELHLRARHEMFRVTKESLNHSVQLIKNGINILGENEILYANLGLAYLYLYIFISKEDKSFIKKAEDCIEKVFSLNPESSHGHSLKGNLYLRLGDIRKAINEFRKALEIDPNEEISLFFLGFFYALSGKGTEGRSILGRLLEIDPLTPLNHMVLGALELFEGRSKSGLKHIVRAHELEPENPLLRFWVAVGLAYDHRYDEAYPLFDLIEKETTTSILPKLSQFFKYALQGKKELALKAATEDLKSVAKEDEMFPIWMAESYALIEERNEAIDWLEHGINFGFIHYPWLSEHDPFLKNIRDEERFKKLMERVKYEREIFEV